MRKIFYVVLMMALAGTLSACQSFLEDYNYSPMGSSSSGSGY